ncbi:MAG: c-type cytochrome domain-containing protein [Rubripirellula sp.]
MRTLDSFPLAACAAAALLMTTFRAAAQDQPSPLDESGHVVTFERDIAPILQSRCLECHGPEDAKNDFRVDDRDTFMDYIEPEDIESSSLFVDYLATDDPDMLMPPESHQGPLSPAELALIRVWINEGAEWPESVTISEGSEQPAPIAAPIARTIPERVWAAMGYLHPATIHFPIALFLLGAAFVVLGWKWPTVGFQIPLACLLIGTATAIASTVMGWSFAVAQGYGGGWSPMDWSREIDVHRWSGLIVTVVSCIVSAIALMSLWKDSESLTKYWKIGLLLVAGMVGAVGHQGGELSYGADFYPRALRILIGTEGAPDVEQPVAEEAVEPSE